MVKWSYRGIMKCCPLRGLNLVMNYPTRVEDMPQTIKIQSFLNLLRLNYTKFVESSNCFYGMFVFDILKNKELSKKQYKGVLNYD